MILLINCMLLKFVDRVIVILFSAQVQQVHIQSIYTTENNKMQEIRKIVWGIRVTYTQKNTIYKNAFNLKS